MTVVPVRDLVMVPDFSAIQKPFGGYTMTVVRVRDLVMVPTLVPIRSLLMVSQTCNKTCFNSDSNYFLVTFIHTVGSYYKYYF